MEYPSFLVSTRAKDHFGKPILLGLLLTLLFFLSACTLKLYKQDLSSTPKIVQSIPTQFKSKPSLSISDAQETEGLGSETGGTINQIKFVITINQPSDQVISFKYSTTDGSAKNSMNDYRSTAGLGVIAPGSTSVEIPVDVFPDSYKEGPETFQLVISNISGALLQDSVGQGTIIDEDQGPAAYLSHLNRNILESSGASLSPWAVGREAWTKRMKLKISNKRQSSVSNFPVLVKLNSQRINYSEIKADGSDLLFLADDGVTLLPYEIEVWNPAGDSFIWVKVPFINGSSTSDHIWMYYGNPAASFLVVTTDVWDSNFVGVWHLTGLTNSTINTITATNNGAVTAAGIAGSSFYFDGVAAYLDLGNPAALPAALTARTLCVWANPEVISSSSSFLAAYGSNVSKQAFSLGLMSNFALGDFKTANKIISSLEVVKQDQWAEYCLTFDGFSANVFVNGANVSSEYYLDTWSLVRALFYIGRGIDGLGYFKGKIDEVRISNTVRSSTWMALEYAAARDALLHYGTPESPNAVSNDYFEIMLDSPSTQDATVPYEIAGTASFGTDHNLASGTVTIPAGQTSVQIFFVYYRERLLELDETIIVSLGEPTGVGRVVDSTATLTLVDELNSPPVVSDRIVNITPQEFANIDLLSGATDGDGDPLVIQMVGISSLVNRSITGTFLQLRGLDDLGVAVLDVIISDGYSSVNKKITVNVASPFTWTGASGDGLWSTPANWSGLQVPSANSRVYFDGTACGTHCDVTINGNIDVRFIGIGSSFQGTITQQGGSTITVGATGLGGFIQRGGTFLGGMGAISISGSADFLVGTFRATSGTLTFAAPPLVQSTMLDFTNGFNFQHNNGSVVLVGPSTETYSADSQFNTTSQVQFNNLTVTRNGPLTNWSNVYANGQTIYVQGNFISTGNRVILRSGEVHLMGNFTQSNTDYSMSGSNIFFEGTGLQTYSCSGTCRGLHKFTINKASGSVEPLNTNVVAVSQFDLQRGTFKASSSKFKVGGVTYYYGSGGVARNLFTVSNGTTFIPNGGTLTFDRSDPDCWDNAQGTFIKLPTDQYFVVNHLSFEMHPFASRCASWNNTYILPETYGFRVLGNANLGYGKFQSGNLLVEGSVTMSTGLEANSTTALTFVGNNPQTWTHSAGNMIIGTITIDKPLGEVTLGSNITLNTAQSLILNQGTLNQAAAPPGFSLAVPGTLSLQTSTTINQLGGSLTYGTLSNLGTINP